MRAAAARPAGSHRRQLKCHASAYAANEMLSAAASVADQMALGISGTVSAVARAARQSHRAIGASAPAPFPGSARTRRRATDLEGTRSAHVMSALPQERRAREVVVWQRSARLVCGRNHAAFGRTSAWVVQSAWFLPMGGFLTFTARRARHCTSRSRFVHPIARSRRGRARRNVRSCLDGAACSAQRATR